MADREHEFKNLASFDDLSILAIIICHYIIHIELHSIEAYFAWFASRLLRIAEQKPPTANGKNCRGRDDAWYNVEVFGCRLHKASKWFPSVRMTFSATMLKPLCFSPTPNYC